MPARPDRLVAILGTGTGVGKTWVAAALLQRFGAAGTAVAARKPVQSFDPSSGEATDADLLAAATGEEPEQVCPPHRWYELALAPPMAAEVLGRAPFTVDELVGELTWQPGTDVGVVETVGGPRSPVAADGDSVALCAALQPDVVVLVAHPGLGAINAVRLSAQPVLDADWPLVVVANRYHATDIQRRNVEWLRRDGYRVATGIAETAAAL